MNILNKDMTCVLQNGIADRKDLQTTTAIDQNTLLECANWYKQKWNETKNIDYIVNAEILEHAASNDCQKFKEEALLDIINKKRVMESVEYLIFVEIARIINNSQDRARSQLDVWSLTAYVKGIFRKCLGMVPAEIEVACKQSEAILSASKLAAQEDRQKTISMLGGASGAGMVLYGVGNGLGWGASFLTRLGRFFWGTSLVSPIGWAVGGFSLIALMFSNSSKDNLHERTMCFIESLIESVNQAIDTIWKDYGEKLAKWQLVKNTH